MLSFNKAVKTYLHLRLSIRHITPFFKYKVVYITNKVVVVLQQGHTCCNKFTSLIRRDAMLFLIGLFSLLAFLFLGINASALAVDRQTQERITASIDYLKTHDIQPAVESRYVVDCK